MSGVQDDKRVSSSGQQGGRQKKQRLDPSKTSVAFPNPDDVPSSSSALRSQVIKKTNAHNVSRQDLHRWLVNHIDSVQRGTSETNQAQRLAALYKMHELLFEACKASVDKHINKIVNFKQTGDRDAQRLGCKRANLRQALKDGIREVLEWRTTNATSDEERKNARSLLERAEDVSALKGVSVSQKLEDDVRKLEHRKAERMLLNCDILDGISTDWTKRQALAKHWSSNTNTLKNVINSNMDKSGLSGPEREAYEARISSCLEMSSQENRVSKGCESWRRSKSKADSFRTTLLQEEALVQAIQAVREQWKPIFGASKSDVQCETSSHGEVSEINAEVDDDVLEDEPNFVDWMLEQDPFTRDLLNEFRAIYE